MEGTTMKYAILTLAAVVMSYSVQMPTVAQTTSRALTIRIFGMGSAVDSQAVKAVRDVIGTAVTKGVIDTYVTYGYGIEGGSSFCIQLSPYEDATSLVQLERKLLQIQPNRETTAYEVKRVAACGQQSISPVQMSDLTNTAWSLEDLGGTRVNIINSAQKPTLRFLNTKRIGGQFVNTQRIGGQGGCNHYSANFQINGNRFAVSELMFTLIGCIDPRVQQQEERCFRALGNARKISLEGLYLLIYSDGLDEPLRFSRLTSGR
jgi:heat shock protein HslJ